MFLLLLSVVGLCHVGKWVPAVCVLWGKGKDRPKSKKEKRERRWERREREKVPELCVSS